MTPKKVSNCCGVSMALGKKTEQRDFQFGERNPKYYQVDCLVCLKCSKPCNPVEAKSETLIMDPLGRVQKVSPEIKEAREGKECENPNGICGPNCPATKAHRPTEVWEERLPKLLEKYKTFGSIEDEDFSPVGYFDDRASYNDFIKDIKSFIAAELTKKDEEIKQAREEGKNEMRQTYAEYGYKEVVELEALASYRAELRKKVMEIKRVSPSAIANDILDAILSLLSLLDQEDKPNPPRE